MWRLRRNNTLVGVLAGQTGDVIIEGVCLSLISLIAGFLIWNFPFGKIFLVITARILSAQLLLASQLCYPKIILNYHHS